MKKEVFDYAVAKTHELINAPSCSPETKASAQAWLAAGDDAQATKKYIADLEGDIMPIDGLIQFTKSEAGQKLFGADRAKAIEKHAEDVKAAGGKFCDCPACAAVAAILAKKAEMLA